MLILPLCTVAGNGAEKEDIRAVNLSGNLNTAPSVDPTEKSEGYSAVLYDNKNGLPASEVNAVAQTSEGFLWIGTYSGLIRYDGNTFERIESSERISDVRCLFVDSSGRLWIGTNNTGVFLMESDSFRVWGKEEGISSTSIRSITEDPQGVIYIASAAGIDMIDKDMRLSTLEDERIAGQTIMQIRCGSDGLIYGVSGMGDLFMLKDGKTVSYYAEEDSPFNDALSVLPDPEKPGFLYIGTEKNVCYGSPEKGFESRDMWESPSLMGIGCMEYIDGQIWVCSRTGIGKLDNGTFHQLQDIPMDNSFCNIMTDMDNNLWIASSREGIVKIVTNRFTDLFAEYGLPSEVVNSTCIAGGQLFIGTDEGLAVLKDGKKVKQLPLSNAVTASGTSIKTSDLLEYLDGIRIRSIIRDSKNRLWISTSRMRGLIRYDQGTITQFSEDDGLLSEQVRMVTECEDGSILAATNNGLNVIKGDRVIRGYGQEEGIDVPNILTIAEGNDHEIIAGTDGGGIYIIDDDEVDNISTEEGLASDIILRIKRSRSRDLFWIITGTSLSAMTPDHEVKTIRDFPYDNNYDLYENSNGDLWVLGSSGICVITSDELSAEAPAEDTEKDPAGDAAKDAAEAPAKDHAEDTEKDPAGDTAKDAAEDQAEDHAEDTEKDPAGDAAKDAAENQAEDPAEPLQLGIPNGLPFVATANSYSELTKDGTLYISGNEGVVKVNIDEPFENVSDMRIVVPYIDADDERYFPDRSGEFTLPSDTRTLKIYPFVIDYSLIDPQVTYHLDGSDLAPTSVKRSELRPVTYTHLAGGSYQFVIELKGTAGHENNVLSVPVVKVKSLSEHAWFNITAMAIALLILFGLLFSYFRREMRAMEKKHREEAERERIGRELSLANQIQSSMLPDSSPVFTGTSGFAVSASMEPAKEVGGDFYDYFLVDDDHLCMTIADVSGKGIPAALFMMASKIVLTENAKDGKSPSQIMAAANTSLCANNKLGMFVTVWLGILEISTGKLTASNAGHEYPILKEQGGQFELIKDKHGFVLGGFEEMKYSEYEIMLQPGAKLFLYTDGIPEASNAEKAQFGTDRLLDTLNSDKDGSPEQIIRNVQESVKEFAGEAEQFDDLTMICMEYKGPDPAAGSC